MNEATAVALSPRVKKPLLGGRQIEFDGKTGSTSRDVYRLTAVFDDFVIKVDSQRPINRPKSRDGWFGYSQTRSEVIAQDYIDPEDRQYFPKLLAHGETPEGETWAMFEKVDMDEHGYAGFDAGKIRETVQHLIEKYGISDLSSNSPNNWGVRRDNGLPCIYDFAGFGYKEESEKNLFEFRRKAQIGSGFGEESSSSESSESSESSDSESSENSDSEDIWA